MDKKSKKIIGVFIFMLTYSPLYISCQDAIFSQFYANPLYLNPAIAGTDVCPSLHLNHRNHPYPGFGHLATFSASYQRPWEAVSGGIGFLITSEHFGQKIRQHFIGGIYSYHTKLTRNLNMNFGVNASYLRRDLHWDNLVFPDQYDPFSNELIPTSETLPEKLWINALDVSAGVLFYNENFFAGLATHHLTQPQKSFFSDKKLPIKTTLHAGTKIPVETYYRMSRQNFYVSPNIILQHQHNFFRTSYGTYFEFEPITFGVWFRQDFKEQKTLIFLLGLHREDYKIGYSFDHSFSGYYTGLAGVHEISVLLKFNCEKYKLENKILRCPNF